MAYKPFENLSKSNEIPLKADGMCGGKHSPSAMGKFFELYRNYSNFMASF